MDLTNELQEIEFDDNTSIDDIYNILVYYNKHNIFVKCKYSNYTLTNLNIDLLKNNIEKIKQKIEDKKVIYNMFNKKKSFSFKLKYFISRAKENMSLDDQDDFECKCYGLLIKDYKAYNQPIILSSRILIILNQITNKDDLEKVKNYIDQVLFDLPSDFPYHIFIELVSKYTKDKELLNKLLLNYISFEEVSDLENNNNNNTTIVK